MVTYLPAGATVHTATETREILRENRFVENQLIIRRYQNDLSARTRAIERPGKAQPDPVAHKAEANRRNTDRLISAWHERPEQRLSERGLETYTKRGNNVTRHVNRRYRRHEQ